MKLTTTLTIALLPAAFALPTVDTIKNIFSRQSLNTITDSYLFSITLPQFTTNRNARNPSTLDWQSDGCTSSPDNPFGFNFPPACARHDFGYHNYRLQSRFTVSGKKRIDDNFKTDLKYQCNSESPKFVCNALADVYYTAVRAFGGGDATPGKRDEKEVEAYEKAVAEYDRLVTEAQAAGELPVLESA